MPRRKGDNLNFLEFQLFRIARFLESIERKVTKVGEGQDALDAAIGNLNSVADGLKSSIDQAVTVITALVTKLQGSVNAPDFTQEIQTLQSIADGLSADKSGLDTTDTAGEAAAEITPGAVAADTPAAPTPGVGDPAPGAGATPAENPAPPQVEGVNVFPAGSTHDEPAPETAAEPASGEAPPVPPPPGT